jgi:hypothetical protein
VSLAACPSRDEYDDYGDDGDDDDDDARYADEYDDNDGDGWGRDGDRDGPPRPAKKRTPKNSCGIVLWTLQVRARVAIVPVHDACRGG